MKLIISLNLKLIAPLQMKRHKENSFTKKFDLLNSQEHNVDIRWSSSESSDYENITSHIHGTPTLNDHRKRKRKKKVPKNLSNLNFNVVQATKEDKKVRPDKSPVLRYIETKTIHKSSPIIPSKVNVSDIKRDVKSPVLLLKQKSVLSPTIKKRLFVANDHSKLNKTDENNIRTSKELEQSSTSIIKTDTKAVKSISHNNNNYATSSYVNKISNFTEIPLKECDDKLYLNTDNNRKVVPSNNAEKTIDISKPRTKIDLIKKVQSYFDSQFGSDSASQQSISETETLTQKSDTKSSDDLEITNSLSQKKDNSPLPMQSSSVVSHGSWEVKINTEKSKKTKYKKDGLAHRLDQLLKKQNASISLWQHEKFLAKNSKFIIPKNEHIVFRIQKINFKYGSYLLETLDLNDERHLIFINGYYVHSACNLAPDIVLKLYMPYKILDLSNHYKIVINVCKFECVPIVN